MFWASFIAFFRRRIYVNFESALSSSNGCWIRICIQISNILVLQVLALARCQFLEFFGFVSVKDIWNRSVLLRLKTKNGANSPVVVHIAIVCITQWEYAYRGLIRSPRQRSMYIEQRHWPPWKRSIHLNVPDSVSSNHFKWTKSCRLPWYIRHFLRVY